MTDTRTYPACQHRSDGRPCVICIGDDLRTAATRAVDAIEGFNAAIRKSQRRHPIPFPDPT